MLQRDATSYGYFLLAPNAWDPNTKSLWRVLTLERVKVPTARTQLAKRIVQQSPPTAILVHISQPQTIGKRSTRAGVPRGAPLHIVCRPTVSLSERSEIKAQLSRMLRLDDSSATIAAFHKLDPRFRKGGQGRLLRSPTLFEDIIKTVTSCNVQWPGTITMNKQLCDYIGPRVSDSIRVPGLAVIAGFPTASQLAAARPAMLRARCRVGYRDERIVALAKLFCTPVSNGGVDQDLLTNPTTTDEALHATLIALPGVGPYAAANIMQLLGRFHRLPLDSEALKHGREVLGLRGSKSQVLKAVKSHFAKSEDHAFRSYWFELRQQHEAKHGPAHTWKSSQNGRILTAAFPPIRRTLTPQTRKSTLRDKPNPR